MDLASGEAFAEDWEILLFDSVAIVLDLQEAHASILAQYVDLRGPCVDRVFNELFECSTRRDDDLTSRNFVNG